MNQDSQWRLALAERIAAAYIENPKAAVVMIAGSVGRGVADRYSDIEIDVYYTEPPTEAERIASRLSI
jgi:predicted nucleotidyltransferase